MKWLGTPQQAREAVTSRQEREAGIRCPDCGSSLPNFRMVELTEHSWVGGRVVETIVGYRVACQSCPCVYSIGPAGTFRQHERSLPLTPQLRSIDARPPRATVAGLGPDDDEDRPPRPMPLQAPRI